MRFSVSVKRTLRNARVRFENLRYRFRTLFLGLLAQQRQKVEEVRRRSCVQQVRHVVEHVAENLAVAGLGGEADVDVGGRSVYAQ